ncbi:hypothetical protein JXB11_05010 [Candidatus Woesearchaeota archaeon]|nr:hypothetical protein [Candidatus Woesearchaeota archaeon]
MKQKAMAWNVLGWIILSLLILIAVIAVIMVQSGKIDSITLAIKDILRFQS